MDLFFYFISTSFYNARIDYISKYNKKSANEFPIEDYTYLVTEEYDFIQAIVDYDVVKNALKLLSDREKKIIVVHVLEDKDFGEIGVSLGLTYKGTATVFYRAIGKMREVFGRYRDEL